MTLAQSIVLHLKMFFIAGDPYFRYNVAGRPYFTLPEGVLLLIGIGDCRLSPDAAQQSRDRARGLSAGAARAADGDSERDLGRRAAAEQHALAGHGAADLRAGRGRRGVGDWPDRTCGMLSAPTCRRSAEGAPPCAPTEGRLAASLIVVVACSSAACSSAICIFAGRAIRRCSTRPTPICRWRRSGWSRSTSRGRPSTSPRATRDIRPS